MKKIQIMIVTLIGALALGACASAGAPKPNCGGTLRAVNAPVVTAAETRP